VNNEKREEKNSEEKKLEMKVRSAAAGVLDDSVKAVVEKNTSKANP
jgi:hypothetical protein